jgi:acetyl/propionyl-CoA carboxylase alpha subunit
VITNLPFLRALVRDPAVASGAFDTGWIEREFLPRFEPLAAAPAPDLAVAAAALAEMLGLSFNGAGNGAHGASAPAATATDPFAALGRWRQPGLE